MKHHSRTNPAAFTLIELLVVIAIIALLISILLPSLASARGVARQLTDAAIQKGLTTAQHGYMNNFKDQYAGPNTSGIYYHGMYVGSNPLAAVGELLNDTDSTRPTTTHDWICPTLGDTYQFSPNRARRTQQLFNRLRDPAARITNDTLFGTAADSADFRTALTDGGFFQGSFLSPSNFHYLSSQLASGELPTVGRGVLRPYYQEGHSTPAVIPPSFRPRLEKVGIQLSQKIILMDGSRYLSADGLDFDIAPDPSVFGSFLDNPAYYGSTAYGRDPGSGGGNGGRGWKLSIRHPNNSLNASFFDGHTASMRAQELWQEPKYVYPSGSIWNGTDGNPEAISKYPAGTVIE